MHALVAAALVLALQAASSVSAASRCSSRCSEHGTCHEELGRCDCLKGYKGIDCSEIMPAEELLNASRNYGYRSEEEFMHVGLSCLNGCNGRGACRSGVCQCQPGYFGTDCCLSLDSHGTPQLLAGSGYTTRTKRPYVYVYELPPELTTWHSSRRVDRPLWLLFWQRLLSSGARTADATQADWFFIPLRVRTSKDSEPLLQTLDYLRDTWPWWNQTQGQRHFLFHLGDTGAAELTRSTPEVLRGAVEAGQNLTWLTHWGLTEANEVAAWRPAHVPGRDIVVPVLFSAIQIKALGLRSSPHHPQYNFRRHSTRHTNQDTDQEDPRGNGVEDATVGQAGQQDLLFFGGRICGDRGLPNSSWPNCGGRAAGYSGQVRQRMYYHHHNRPGFVITTHVEGWAQHVMTTRFCLAPPGSGHGYRQVLVALLGCIPVVIGDDITQPFEPELDWTHFAVEPSEAQIPRLHDILQAIDGPQLRAMRANLRCAAEHMSWTSITGGVMGETGRYDAFETTLEILRMKRRFPRAAPFEYVDLDPQFAQFMNCGARGPMSSGAPVSAVEVPGWGLLQMLGTSSEPQPQQPQQQFLTTDALGLTSTLSQGATSQGATKGQGATGGQGATSQGAAEGQGAGAADPSPDLSSLVGPDWVTTCSHSQFDPPESSCRRCGGKSLPPVHGLPGGMICCGAPSLAECPRLWL